MFSTISWSQYSLTVFVAIVIYYLFSWILLYKAKWALLPRHSSLRTSIHAEDQEDMIVTAQQVIDEISPLLRRDLGQHEILFALQRSLQKYTDCEERDFRDTVNRFILQQLTTKCSIRLAEDDLRAIWK